MSKFSGSVGYIEMRETKPGVWEDSVKEVHYTGDLLKNVNRVQTTGDKVNDDIVLSNQVSIVADPYANQNFQSMRYIVYRGTKWKITNVEVSFPRLILTIGGVYNG